VPIGGETSHSFRRTSTDSDTSDKDSGVYGSSKYGLQRISVGLSGNLKLPDPGFAALFAASKTPDSEIEVQIAKGDVVKYQCVSSIGNFSHEAPNTGPVTFSCDLANAAAPTVDNLVAVAAP
jgi:hypothetical protein